MDYKPGDRLCSCTLVEKCGHGSYGDVWLAEDSIGARVALKIIENRGSYSERELNGLKNYKNCKKDKCERFCFTEGSIKALSTLFCCYYVSCSYCCCAFRRNNKP